MMGSYHTSYDSADKNYQDYILPGVSRTFALTIPQLPPPLQEVVANGYLLCRIADTIEDEPTLSIAQKKYFSNLFVTVVAGQTSAESFACSLYPLLSEHTLAAERELIQNAPRILRITYSFNPRQRAALERCVCIMCDGMPRFQNTASLRGLADMEAMDQYCYFVAGVVGEMLTELFCDYSPGINRNREALRNLMVSFGQGLQMTNILKDIWDDRKRRICWLPRTVFEQAGFNLDNLEPGHYQSAFGDGLQHLIGVTHAHLRNALTYTLLIPPEEGGIRRFCLWAIGLAMLTLRKLHRRRNFSASWQVKISRRSVKTTILLTSIAANHDKVLTFLFNLASKGVPFIPLKVNSNDSKQTSMPQASPEK
ncbi:farnesyl-diphosphate farnesyltransferase [Nitrosococcus oceani ATCC 19707]|uniref:Farnesyl-diphosphate farnesyltransferase n=2 Tax=Nitrosococcus oceani TaxID=1229 RepID=Q3JBH7_NITOC|nr:phytoene/squalene synthase family protein [Nitrosococcus oceani]ABA57819.1 farnesyl-diphosphate farnesyltransferase [Nitrosococcus oceani ATCC 19707]EDZ67479.1 Squalene and phytoene synthases superfamily [Nitrosococcus oceani AFC27]KFI19758.1 phytoene synthase [Nitrosococcus oceani C-27]